MDSRLHPLLELTRARWLEFVRDKGTIFWVFGFPVLLAVALGIAFRNRGPESVRVAIIGAAASEITSRLGSPQTLEVVSRTNGAAFRELRSGRLDMVVEVEKCCGAGASLAYHFDETRPNGPLVRLAVDDAIQRALGRVDVATVHEEQVTESGARYIDFLLPGLIGLNVMGSCLWGLGYSVADARRRKLLKRFAATPMRRTDFLLAFVLSRFGFLVAEVAFVLAFGVIAFDVQVHGTLAAVFAISVMGTLAFAGLALLIASRTDNSEVASGWINFASIPMWVFSGAFFDYSRFPESIQPYIRALPLTAINDGLRAVVNHGDSLAQCWFELLVLTAWTVVTFVLALRLFRWQ